MRVATIIFTLAAIFAGQAAAQQQPRYSSGWNNPDRTAPVQPQVNAEIRKLTDELKALIEDAERARAADPRFLRDLRSLARRYAWPWRRQVLSDNFSDGDWTRNPAWKVWGQGLRINSWDGVSMRVVATAPQHRRRRDDDRNGLAGVLGSVFSELARRDDDRYAGAAPAPRYIEAGMRAAIKVPNAFAIRLTLSSTTHGTGRFEFGVGQGRRNLGYRVAYNAGARPALELLRVGSSGTAVIEVANAKLKLEDGKPHVVQFTRNRRGRMVVSVDGKELLRVRDRSFRSDFDGVVLIDKRGAFNIRSVVVHGAG